MSLDEYTQSELKETILDKCTIDELKEAIDKREKESKKVPSPIEFPNFDPVKKQCIELVDSIKNKDQTKDAANCIFEAAMEAVYGKDVWGWYRDNYMGE